MQFTKNVVVQHENMHTDIPTNCMKPFKPNIPPTSVWKLVKCYFDIFSTNINSPVSFSMTKRNTTIMWHFKAPLKNGSQKRAWFWKVSILYVNMCICTAT